MTNWSACRNKISSGQKIQYRTNLKPATSGHGQPASGSAPAGFLSSSWGTFRNKHDSGFCSVWESPDLDGIQQCKHTQRIHSCLAFRAVGPGATFNSHATGLRKRTANGILSATCIPGPWCRPSIRLS
mmetsp:Transcript_20476/g.48754  ORF Transcript_20476/g.48754 Transcript_20476/m.48754 type:complete len:128 (-) Transcript_20476:1081-1464(-)